MFYEDVFRSLNTFEVRYLIVGGLAVNLQGVVRLTADLDLFLDLDEENLVNAVKALSSIGYRPRVPVDFLDFSKAVNREMWKREKEMKVFTVFHKEYNFQQIDLFVYEPLPFDEVYSRKDMFAADDINLPVMCKEDLICLKKQAGRDKDLEDIKALEELIRNER